MTHNQKTFRRILIGLALLCIFLFGSIMNINFSTALSLTLAAVLFMILIAFAVGLLWGYALGAGKNFKFWKDSKKK